MEICLKTYAKRERSEHVVIRIEDRLPVFVHSPGELTCDFHVEGQRNYYLILLEVQGTLELTCQRCLGDFQHSYHNKSEIAVCRSDDVAEQLMASYDCMVSEADDVDLVEIITDELHLYCPEKHSDTMMCDVLIIPSAG